MQQRARELLIVGAGLTGSLTASLLNNTAAGTSRSIAVWDKARGCGGRFTTSHVDDSPSLHVDLGAQYISHRPTAGDEVNGQVYKELLESSVLTGFHGNIAGGCHDNGTMHYVAPRGMSAVCRYFLDKSTACVHYKHCIQSVNIEGRQVVCRTVHGQVGRFDGIVLTLPAPQLLTLQGNLLTLIDPQIRTGLSKVTYSSRYALGLFYDTATVQASPEVFNSSWSAKYCDHDVIRYICWDQSKRGQSPSAHGASLLVHTSVPFGLKHLETDKEQVKTMLCTIVEELLPGLPKHSYSYILRWRYSQVQDRFPGSHDLVVMSYDPLVVATGDSFSGSNFDNCVRAAMATSKLITDQFQ